MEQKIYDYDSNGIDLRFTRPRTEPVNRKVPFYKMLSSPKLKLSWDDQMKAHTPRRETFLMKTDMSNALGSVFNEFLPRGNTELRRKFTLIVLTDGLWEGDRDAVRKYIKSFMRQAHERWDANLAATKKSKCKRQASPN